MALQPDGRILLAGIRNAGNTGQFAVARFTTNGAVDASFNSTGYVYTNIPGPNYGGELHDMVIDPSGRIVVLGIGSPSNANCDWVLCRYLNDADIGIHGPSALSVPRCFPDPVERGVPVQVTWKLADDEDRPDELLLTDMQGRVLMRAPRTDDYPNRDLPSASPSGVFKPGGKQVFAPSYLMDVTTKAHAFAFCSRRAITNQRLTTR